MRTKRRTKRRTENTLSALEGQMLTIEKDEQEHMRTHGDLYMLPVSALPKAEG
jgi:hypothetical protein